jgi:hypothetical protein
MDRVDTDADVRNPGGLAVVMGLPIRRSGVARWRKGSVMYRVIALVVAALVAACASSPTPSTVPASPLADPSSAPSLPSVSPGGAALTVIGGGALCASEGGCVASFSVGARAQPGPSDTWWPPEEVRFQISSSLTGPWAAPPATPTSLRPGDYTLVAALNWVSDVIMGPLATPTIGGVVASCTRQLTATSSVTVVTVRVTFHGQAPCEIEVTSTPS